LFIGLPLRVACEGQDELKGLRALLLGFQHTVAAGKQAELIRRNPPVTTSTRCNPPVTTLHFCINHETNLKPREITMVRPNPLRQCNESTTQGESCRYISAADAYWVGIYSARV
jgi:hypothetical protein